MAKDKKMVVRNIKCFTISNLLAIMVPAFYVVNLLRMSMGWNILYLAALASFGAIGLYKLTIQKSKPPVLVIKMMFFFIVIAGILNAIFIHNMGIEDVFADLLLIGITFLLLQYRISFMIGMLTFGFFFLFFSFHCLSGTDTNAVLHSSTNYISIVLILAVSFYYIGVEENGKILKISDIIPAVLCFLLSIWAGGRGGILSCGVLLFFVTLAVMKNITSKKTAHKTLIFLGVIVLLIIYYMADASFLGRFSNLGKFGTRGFKSTARIIIWSDYLEKTWDSLVYFLLGTPLKLVPSVVEFELNTHNSFLQMHALYGIIPFICFGILALRAAWFYFKNGLYMHLGLLFALFVRGMTDKFIFGQYGMPLVMYFVLLPLVYVQKRTRQRCKSNE